MEKAYKLEFTQEENKSLNVSSCGLSRTQPHHHFGPAIKPHFMFHYIISGKGVFRIGGQEYPLTAGYGFLIVPDEPAYYEADEEDPWTYVWVGFSGRDAASVVEELGLSVTSPLFRNNDTDTIYSYVHDMMEHNTFSLTDSLRRNGLLQMFLSAVASSIVSERSDSGSANYYVRKAVDFIRSNYYNPIRVTDVADYVCVNRSYLYTLFEKTLGESPQKYLSSLRLSRASDLLKITDLPIESIAISCGYSDPLVFSRAFRLEKGISPSGYRKQQRSAAAGAGKESLRQLEEYIEQKFNPESPEDIS